MICPKCQNQNDDEYVFCVNCGEPITNAPGQNPYPSVATVIGAPKKINAEPPPTVKFETPVTVPRNIPNGEVQSPKRLSAFLKVIGLIAFLLFLGFGVALTAYLYYGKPAQPTALLPEHLGLFAVDTKTNALYEIPKREYSNLKDGKEKLMKDAVSLPIQDPNEFILYADSAEIKIDDLKFVRLDSITNEGVMRLHDFQASLIDGKPAMKRLRFPGDLAGGEYAFALINGSFDEGNHKFWPFDVNSTKQGENTPAGREFAVALKEKGTQSTVSGAPPNAQPPAVEVPVGARVAYCNAADVVVRGAPSLTARKINELRRGQKVYLINYSDNFDNWNGIRSNWAYIQTEKGKRGWVFTPFISY